MQGNYDPITLEILFCSLSRERGIPPAANVSEPGHFPQGQDSQGGGVPGKV
jgi:hypothetical protein